MAKATLDGKLLHPSQYLDAVEFHGKDVSLTIAKVERTELMVVGGAKKAGIVIHFEKTAKKLVLNKTNAGVIADLHGTAAEAWVGKRITLFPTTCKFGRDTVACIRVRDKIPEEKAAAPAAKPAQDFPAHCVVGKPGCETDPAAYSTGPDGKPVCANHAR